MKKNVYLADRSQIESLSVVIIPSGKILKSVNDGGVIDNIIKMEPKDNFCDEQIDIVINECGGFYLGTVQIRVKDGKITTDTI